MLKRVKRNARVFLFLPIGIVIYFMAAMPAKAAQNVPESKAVAEASSFFWPVLLVGGCIILTLSYVSWKKYKGEKQKQADEDKTID